MKKEDFSIVIGTLLVCGSIIASIGFHFYFWYGFYVVGAFLLFGGLNYRLKSGSIYAYVLDKRWGMFLALYLAGAALGFGVDIVYGRNVAHLWYYPHLRGVWDYLVPILLYYPFGGLQTAEIFYFCKATLGRRLSAARAYELGERAKALIANSLIIFLALGLTVPLLNLFLNGNRSANELMIVVMVLTTFSADAILYRMGKGSILLEALQGSKAMLATLATSWLLSVFLTEVPNIFSREWVYYNVPFTSAEVLHINIIIFTFGWFFLVCVSARGLDLIRQLLILVKSEEHGF